MRRTKDPQMLLRGEIGFGLVEVLLAVTVASVGVLAAAGVGVAIGLQGRLAGWDTDAALAARHDLDGATAAGFTAVSSSSGTIAVGRRMLASTRSVTTVTSRLKEIRVRALRGGRAPATFTTRIALSRPLPVAP